METAPLKSFATWARTALIREVAARIAVALAPASPERVEQPSAVAALEKAIRAAGGGDAGRRAVADKVAYTWFNRVIALRFMDANGYTGIGVVSPERGREGGQPEVLAPKQKSWRHYPDERHLFSVKRKNAANNCGISIEVLLPDAITHHRYR